MDSISSRPLTRFVPLVLSMFAPALWASGAPAPTEATTPTSAQGSPFYCNVGALSPAERTRHFKVQGPALAAKRIAVRALADGYEFDFSPDPQTYQQLAEWAWAERACCPFFDIVVRLAPEQGRIVLTLTGRPGTKEFIEADGGDWLAPIGNLS